MVQPKLNGLRVMVTRPQIFADSICRKLTSYGAIPTSFPCITIETCGLTPAVINVFKRLKTLSAIIFVSRISVIKTFEILSKFDLVLPPHNIFAVGSRTANELAQFGIMNVTYPKHQFSAMALLKEGLLNEVKGGEVLIVKGRGGNEALRIKLQKQGTKVICADLYERKKPTASLVLDKSQLPHAIFITSRDTLTHLFEMTEQSSRDLLRHIQLIVGSPTINVLAKELGFYKPVIVAKSPADDDMLNALERTTIPSPSV